MTVKELIDELEKYPIDMKVTDGSSVIDEVFVKDEFYDGDSANPNYPCYKVLVIV